MEPSTKEGGHVRAERHVLREVQHRLDKCPYTSVFGDVQVVFDDGLLTLQGHVPSFYLKQMLQEVVRGIDRVGKIDNDVEVVWSVV
jgi:hypothetical protein